MSAYNWYPRKGSFGVYEESFVESELGRFVIKRLSTDVSTQYMDMVWTEVDSWLYESLCLGYPIESSFSKNKYTIIIDYPNRMNREWTQRIVDKLNQLIEKYPVQFRNQTENSILDEILDGIRTLRLSS